MKKFQTGYAKRTEKLQEKSLSKNYAQSIFIISGFFCYFCGFIVLLISTNSWDYSDEVGYVIASIWAGIGLIMFFMAIHKSQRNVKLPSFAIPVDEDGNRIKPQRKLKALSFQKLLIAQNKMKLSAILLILVGFYFSILALLVFSDEDSELFLYSFPFVIFLFVGFSAMTFVPGLKANLKALNEIKYFSLLFIIPSYLIILVDVTENAWLGIGVSFGSFVLAVILVTFSRKKSKRRYKFRSGIKTDEEASARHGYED